MSAPDCDSGTPLTVLLGYWLGELDAAREVKLEEHLFTCDRCHSHIRQFVDLGRDIRAMVRTGEMGLVLTASFVTRLQQSGVRVREYRLQPGGSVNCTIAPEDDLVVTHLHAPLGGIHRLDLVGHDDTAGTSWRFEDIAFDPGSDNISVANDTEALRLLSFATIRMELRAVEGARERLVASYTFNHSPHT